MKKIKGRKQMISFLLSICMIITMIPLNAFASSVASASDFKYDTPEDITIYKNETEVVILMDYGYTYENGNDYKKCNLETISASSNNRNIEIRQPEQSEKESGWKMKVKGLSEGISTVTLQYSWKYNGVKKTGTSSFKVTVRAYQYCWKLDGDYDYLEDEYDSDTSNLYINESKTWDITLKKIYYKENGKRAKQLIKNFDISTKVYRRVEDDSSYDYQDIVDNSLLSVNIDKVNNTVTVTGKKEAEAYLDIQVKYQGEIINRENSEEEENKKETLVFNVIKDSYTILCNSSAYVPMREGEGWTKDSYVSVGEKKKLTFQLMHFYYDKASERRKSEILSDAEIKAYIIEEGDEENIRTELTNVAKTFEHSEMSFTNNVLTVKGIKSGGYYDREEQVNLDAYISGKKVYSSYAIFEIYEKNSKSMGRFPDINSYDQEYKENFVHIEKNTNKKISIGRFEVDDSSWDKNTPYKVDSIEATSSNPSVAAASVPKMDEDGDYFLTLKGKNSGSTIITFNYTYIVGGSVNTGSQKVEVLVGQPAKTYYQLKFESIGNGIFEENDENSDYSYSLEMPSPYKTKLKAKLYEVNKEYRKLTLGTRLATAVCIFLVIISAMLVIYGNNLNAKDAYYAEYNIYQQAVEKQSDKAENLGLKLLNNKSYRSFYKLHPEEKAQILYQMGNLYLEKEQYEKASSYFQDSLNTGTSLLECYRDYAICSLDMGNLLKGKRLMNEAKEQGLSNAEYILVEGEMAFLKKEYRKALGDFKKAKETAADEEVRQKGASFYAKTCITLTDYQEAIKTLEAKGEYELADWMNLAFAYKCTGNWKKSKELLLQAVLYYPEDYRLYMRLCYLECELQDRKPQALKDYSQLKVYYDKAVSLLNGKTGNEEWIQLKSLIVQLKEYGWM